MNGTAASSTRKITAPPIEKRLARSRGIIEIRIITGSDTAIQISWR